MNKIRTILTAIGLSLLIPSYSLAGEFVKNSEPFNIVFVCKDEASTLASANFLITHGFAEANAEVDKQMKLENCVPLGGMFRDTPGEVYKLGKVKGTEFDVFILKFAEDVFSATISVEDKPS